MFTSNLFCFTALQKKCCYLTADVDEVLKRAFEDYNLDKVYQLYNVLLRQNVLEHKRISVFSLLCSHSYTLVAPFYHYFATKVIHFQIIISGESLDVSKEALQIANKYGKVYI